MLDPRDGAASEPEGAHARRGGAPASDDLNFIIEGGAPTFDQRLTLRAKLTRGAIGVSLVVVAAFVLLGGPATVRALLPSTPSPIRHAHIGPHASFPTSAIATITPPVDASDNTLLALGPVNGAPGGAYACWVNRDAFAAPGALALAYRPDTHSPWQARTTPLPLAGRCALSPDAANAQAVLLELWQQPPEAPLRPCDQPQLFLSDDSGAHWHAVAWVARSSACDLRFWLMQGRIYASAEVPILPTSASAPGRFIITTDQGRTWRAADTGLDPHAQFRLVTLRLDARLLAQTTIAGPLGGSTLWQSQDDGASWQSLGDLPAAQPTVYASDSPTDTSDGGWGRLYLSAQTETNGVADGPAHLYLATATVGSGWTPLPAPPELLALPVVGATTPFYDVTVGPAETLIITRLDQTADTNPLVTPYALWRWNPARRQWAWDANVIPNSLTSAIAVWSGDALTIWCTAERLSVTRPSQIVAITLTPADLG